MITFTPKGLPNQQNRHERLNSRACFDALWFFCKSSSIMRTSYYRPLGNSPFMENAQPYTLRYFPPALERTPVRSCSHPLLRSEHFLGRGSAAKNPYLYPREYVHASSRFAADGSRCLKEFVLCVSCIACFSCRCCDFCHFLILLSFMCDIW